MDGWTAILSALAGLLSAVTAAVAIWLAVQNNHRAWELARAQVYLALRQSFTNILTDLGDLSEEHTPDRREQLARMAYWHHSYDEWRVSRLAPKQFGDFWLEHFRKATLSGLAHPALRKTLMELRSHTSAGFGAYAQDFMDELLAAEDQLRKSSTPRGDG